MAGKLLHPFVRKLDLAIERLFRPSEGEPGDQMSTSRRTFLKLSAMAGGSVGLGLLPKIATAANPKPLRMLILGGTGFTGPFQVQYAIKRGHKVTVFNRGRTHPGELPKEAEQLIGDR